MSVTIQHHQSKFFDICIMPPFALDINEAVKAKTNRATTLTTDVAIKVLTSIQRESEMKALLSDNVTWLVLGIGIVVASTIATVALAVMVETALVITLFVIVDITTVFGAWMISTSIMLLIFEDPSEMSQAYQEQADIAESYIARISKLPPGSLVRIA